MDKSKIAHGIKQKHVSIVLGNESAFNSANSKQEEEIEIKKKVLEPSQEKIRKNLKESIKQISKHRRVYIEKSYEHDMMDVEDEIAAVDIDDVIVDNDDNNDENDDLIDDQIEETIPLDDDEDNDLENEGDQSNVDNTGIDDSSYGPDKDTKTDGDISDGSDIDDTKTDATFDNEEDDKDMDISEIVAFRSILQNHSFRKRFTFYKTLLQKSMHFDDCSELGL